MKLLTGTITPGQSGPKSNGSEEVLHIFQSSRSRASPLDAVQCPTQDTPFLVSIFFDLQTDAK